MSSHSVAKVENGFAMKESSGAGVVLEFAEDCCCGMEKESTEEKGTTANMSSRWRAADAQKKEMSFIVFWWVRAED